MESRAAHTVKSWRRGFTLGERRRRIQKEREEFAIRKGKSWNTFLFSLLTQRLLLTNQQTPQVWLLETPWLYLTAWTCVASGERQSGEGSERSVNVGIGEGRRAPPSPWDCSWQQRHPLQTVLISLTTAMSQSLRWLWVSRSPWP